MKSTRKTKDRTEVASPGLWNPAKCRPVDGSRVNKKRLREQEYPRTDKCNGWEISIFEEQYVEITITQLYVLQPGCMATFTSYVTQDKDSEERSM